MKILLIACYSITVFGAGIVIGLYSANNADDTQNPQSAYDKAIEDPAAFENNIVEDFISTDCQLELKATHFAHTKQSPTANSKQQDIESLKKRLNVLVKNNGEFHQLETAFMQWLTQDMSGALAWLTELPSADNTDALYYPALRAYINEDIVAAGDFIAAMNNETVKTELSLEYVSKLATVDLEKAINWSSTIYDATAREHALHQAIESTISVDPLRALDYVTWASMDASREETKILIAQAAYQLSVNDIDAAIGNLMMFSNDLQPQMAYGIMSHWSGSDKPAALNWLNSLSSGDVKDKAIQSYFEHTGGHGQGYSETNLAEQISDQGIRQQIVDKYLTAEG